MPISDLRMCSMAALRWYRAGELIEENLDGYLRAAAGTILMRPARS